MFMSTNDGKNENSGFIKIAIAIIAISLEVLCVAGIKYIDACQRGDNLTSSAATTEATTQQSDDDIDDTTAQTDTNDTEEQSVSAGDIYDLSQKTGLLHKDLPEWETPDMCTDIKQVANAFDEYVLSASTDGLTIPTNGVPEDDISLLNSYIRQHLGVASSCVMVDGKCKIDIEYDDQFFVYRYIVYGVPIPDDNERANALYEALVEMLSAVNMEDMSDYDKELMFHDYITGIADYDYAALTDPKDRDAYTAYGLFIDHECVCEGYSEAMNLLLTIAGIDNYYIRGEASNGSNTDGHAWNQVCIDGDWYHVDATWDDKGDNGISYEFFNVPDAVIGTNHSWEDGYWPECTSMEANYYEYNDLYFSTQDELVAYLSDNSDEIGNKVHVVVGDYDAASYDFSKLVGILWQGGQCYHSVEKLSDDYTYIILYKN